ncbi:MAG TPA: NAD(P)H-dependent oxidoreductase subunit E, partial [Candidatus Marinimicrobia bacterium]|nr:NAD(P)H-dependent oxidoreductase subunit E [Candidatus Neomarinimicrobiota bacterium]HJL78492.1 NAD(P)H-dependent oxidoreductase subunit E [Candidatus Neomarinimicrobiota bacterium]HJN67858.1 NAD(P)H-dependent oxidoreductase subunit E [Candidatus Neomarinimicrobiota bacterium]
MKSKAQPKSGFSFADSERVERILSQYPDKKSATLPLLHLAQSQEGYISSSVIDTIADLVDCHPSVVMDCVSFYTMLYTKPQGRHIIQVCQTLSCSLNGADSLVDHIRDKYEIEPGGTTADDRFTLM